MTKSTRPYQKNEYIKNSKSKNLFQKPKEMVLASEISEQKKERLKTWVTFYRNNMAYFVEHYMGVKLFPYQRYWVTLMGLSTDFLAIASRASAKSWLIAVYAIARCILYPGTIVALNSSTKSQAGLIISEKCKELIDRHPNIQRECENIVTNQNKWEMTFHNGSKINVVISGEGGRGHRSNVSVLEERRLIPTNIIDSIIRPFAIVRQAPYLKNPKYSHLQEEPQEIIITSAYYKSHEWWIEAKKLLRMIADGDPDVKGIFLDYLIILKHGIKTKKYMAKEKKKLDPVTFLMEYGNIPYSSSSSSFYKVGFFNRKIKHGWLPQRDDFTKKNLYDIKRQPDEKRIVSVDIAMRRGSYNDNTIITCARLFPTKKGWLTEVCYLESHNGRNTMSQALRIKQIYHEFTGYDGILVLDVANAGISVFDALTTVTSDDVRSLEYPPMTVMNHFAVEDKVYEELKDRTLGQNAIECIFPISATALLNSTIAISFRDRLKRRLLSFLVDDNVQEDFLIKAGNKDILDLTDETARAYLLQSNIQTTLLINECISLEMTIIGNGLVKVVEPSGGRKDRFTSCAYLNYFVGLMDQELLKVEDKTDDLNALLSVTFMQ
jgi:hypothetical protein